MPRCGNPPLRKGNLGAISQHSNLRHNQLMQTLNSSALFSAKGLVKRYGSSTVVDDLSFDIAPGECLGVIGPNGAGKTTTIRMCLGLTAPDAGSKYFPNQV